MASSTSSAAKSQHAAKFTRSKNPFFLRFMWWSYLLLCELQQLKATWRLCSCFLRSIKVRTSQFSLVRISQFCLAPYKSIRNCLCPKGENYETTEESRKWNTEKKGEIIHARPSKSEAKGEIQGRLPAPDSVFPFCLENEAGNGKKLTLLLF